MNISNKSICFSSLWLIFFLNFSVPVHGATLISGTVIEKRADTVKVEFEPHEDAAPKIGDRVDFKKILDGFEVNAGQGEVVEIAADYIWVKKAKKSKANLKMTGVIHATGVTSLVSGTPLLHQETGVVARGWLGVRIQDVDRDLAESFGLDRPAGALIAEVTRDSPAEQSGLELGDVILEFDGVDINQSSDLVHVVGRSKAGSEVDVTVIRNKKKKTINVKVGLLPEEYQQLGAGSGPLEKTGRLGLIVRDLTNEEKSDENVKFGVVVERISEGVALNAGIVEGGIITLLNNEEVFSRERFLDIVRDLPENKAISVRMVYPGGASAFLVLKIRK